MKPIKEQKIRKSVPRHMGRKEKPGPREDFQNVHKVRPFERFLQAEFSGTLPITQGSIRAMVKMWLMDWEHHYRMNDELDSQDVVVTILRSLEIEDGTGTE